MALNISRTYIELASGMAKPKETIFPVKRCRVLRLTREDDKMLFFRLRNLVFLSGGWEKTDAKNCKGNPKNERLWKEHTVTCLPTPPTPIYLFTFRAATSLFLFNVIFENLILHIFLIIMIIIPCSGMVRDVPSSGFYGRPWVFLGLNRPFAGSGHMVRNKLCWDANNAVGLPKQRKSYQFSPTFLCFESPTALFPS